MSGELKVSAAGTTDREIRQLLCHSTYSRNSSYNGRRTSGERNRRPVVTALRQRCFLGRWLGDAPGFSERAVPYRRSCKCMETTSAPQNKQKPQLLQLKEPAGIGSPALPKVHQENALPGSLYIYIYIYIYKSTRKTSPRLFRPHHPHLPAATTRRNT